MKSLVEEALARESATAGSFGPSVAPARPSVQQVSSADAELLDLLQKLRTNIKIIGCGGGGSNTINRIAMEGITGAELYAANTDAQHLLAVRSPHKILLGRRSTRGLGAGALPKIGEESAMEAEEELRKDGVEPLHIEGHDSGSWTLMDYGNVVVHIFSKEGREFYKLDKLWSEAVEIDITDITGVQ